MSNDTSIIDLGEIDAPRRVATSHPEREGIMSSSPAGTSRRRRFVAARPSSGFEFGQALSDFVTGMVKGGEAGMNHWAIKEGNAQSGGLTVAFSGSRPNMKYNPMRKQGAIGLGTGGDNSNNAKGDWFEGVMTAKYSPDAADDDVQKNIVAAYGQQ